MTLAYRPSPACRAALLVFGLSCAGGMAQATQVSRTQTPAPAAMVSTCSGLASGSNVIEAGGLINFVDNRFLCQSAQTAAPGGSVASSSTYTEPLIHHADASAQATLGQVKLSSGFRSNSSLPGFTGGFANGGWLDMLTVLPAQAAQIGQTAIFSFQLHVTGSLAALPQGNSGTSITLTAYRNDVSVNQVGGSGHLVIGGQGQGGFPYSQTVDQIETFSVPVTLGTAFELGIFGLARSGAASRGPDWWSEASNDFSNTITWAGVSGLTVDGQAVVGFSLASASGIDWMGAYTAPVPEPAAAWLLLLGTGALLWQRRGQPRPGACRSSSICTKASSGSTAASGTVAA